MNKDLFYEMVLENVLNEIIEDSRFDNYDKLILALSWLSQLKDEDVEKTIDRHYSKINMSLLNGLSLCNDLGIEEVKVALSGVGMVLFKGNPNDLIEMISFELLESTECHIYNKGYSILITH